ncbi:MAG: glycosyltransferase family protein [Candidatus Omnitrophica bacterium]|nr:glycosyltransferase family protein [Candidatus Omnitrophota bacterium]
MILGVIKARLGSTRLPGKALKEVCGKPLLRHIYERIAFSRLIDKTVIATADTEANKPIVEFAERYGIDYYAGSESDLIDRIYNAAKKFKGDIIVKIGADCPFADPAVIDDVIQFYLGHKDKYDYVCNTLPPTYPDGLDTEVLPFSTIERAWREIKDPFWREWISSYIVEHPGQYKTGNLANEQDLSGLRWTLDYEEDYVFVCRVFEKLYPKKKFFLMDDILRLLRQEPSIAEINKKYARNVAYYDARKEANK